jgi:Glyoxalase-like domain
MLSSFPAAEQRGGAVDVSFRSRAFRRPLTRDGRRQSQRENAVSSTIINVTFDCADPRALARFWGQVTGWPVIEEPQPGYEESAVGTPEEGPRLYFVKIPDN